MAFANPFQPGTDPYKFFDALTEPAQAELLNNSYAMMTIGPVMAARGGYDAAIKDPQSFIFARPGGTPSKGSYEAYMAAHPPNQGGFGTFLKNAVGIALMAYPGVGAALGKTLGLTGTAAAVVGNAAINTALNGGDVLKGVVTAGIPILGKELAGNVASTLVESGMDKALADSASKIVTNVGMAAVQGKDPLTALINSGVTEATASITKDIPGFAGLSDAEQRSINAAITAELTGKDPTQAAINAAISAGNRKMAGTASPTDAASTGSTVGDFEDTEVTRLKGLGYTNDQIREYFNKLDNTTEIFDEPQEPLPVTDPIKTLEDAGLKYLPTDDDFMPTPVKDEVVVTDKAITEPTEPSYLPTDDDFPSTPTKSIEELLVTDKSTKEPSYLPTDDDFPSTPIRDEGELVITDKSTKEPSYLPTDDDFPSTPIRDEGELVMVGERPVKEIPEMEIVDERPVKEIPEMEIVDERPEKEIPEMEIVDDRPVKEPITPTTPVPTTPAPKPTTPAPKPTAPAPAPAAKPTAQKSAVQEMAPALLGIPGLGNVFYYGKDFSSQKQQLDPSGRLIQQEYDPLSVTQAGPELQLDKIAGTNENDVQALIEQIMASNGGDISADELAQILGQGAPYA